MLRPTNAGNTMTFLTIIAFNQLQSKPLVCTASPLPPSWAVLQRNSWTFQATTGSDSGSTSACLWPWSDGTPPAYWPVCKFDLILATLSALTMLFLPVTCFSSMNSHRLPNVCVFCELYCLQYVFCALCKAPVQYCFAPLFSHPD